MSYVQVVKHPVTGLVITPSSNNPEWGTIRVDSENVSFTNGIMNVNRRTAFIRGRVEHLNMMKLTDGKKLPGKIQRQESFSPFYEGQESKINPSTGEIIMTNGKESYIQFQYTEDPAALDLWVGDTSVEVSEDAEKALAAQALG